MAKLARHALLEQLICDGTKYVFGNPGTTEQGFMDALFDYPQLEYILCLHEGVAVSAADAYARATQKPAFIELHTAAGLGNGIGMLSKAKRHCRPLVVYAGNADSRGLLAEPTLGADLVAMARPVTKWAIEARYADEVPLLLRRAAKIAAEPPQGPVFISIPMDIMELPTEAPIIRTNFTNWRTRPPLAELQEAASMLASARRPVILAGDGIALSEAHSGLGVLAEVLGAPIYRSGLETNGPFDHPLNAGRFSPAENPDVDLVLMIGALEAAPIVWTPVNHVPTGARVIQIHPNAWELAKTYRPDLTISAGIKETLEELSSALRTRLTPEQTNAARLRAEHATQRRQAELRRILEDNERRRDQMPISESRLMEELGKAIPEEAAVFCRRDAVGVEPFLKARPGLYFAAGGGGIGSVLPGALGLQLAFPDRPVIGIDGDGSSLYSTTALWTAAHHKLPVTFVIYANAAYRILKVNLLNELGEAHAGREFIAMDLTDPTLDFAKMAESMGVRGQRVERPDDLAGALKDAIAHPGPSLVEVVVDGSIPGRH
jgi:benzoylformate decarboxylase